MKTTILSKSLPALAIALGLGLIPAGVAYAGSDRKVFRKAAGRYEGRFFATLTGQFIQPPIEFVAKGYVRVPVGKGKGYLKLIPNDPRLTSPPGEKTRLPFWVRKAVVRQGGNKVIYRGINQIPARLQPNFGTVHGPVSGRVLLKNQPVLKTNTRMSNAVVALSGPFKGKKKD